MTRLCFSAALFILLSSCSSIPPDIPCQDLSSAYPAFTGETWAPFPLDWTPMPEHPGLAPQGRNGMHSDSYCTEAYPWAGPTGLNPQVHSYRLAAFGGEAATVVFDREGRLFCVSGRVDGFRLLAMDPATGRILAQASMPPRPSMKKFWQTLDMHVILGDSSGGAYFHLDSQDRPIIAGSDRVIRRYCLVQKGDEFNWEVQGSWDLSSWLKADDPVTDCMPGWDGLWWFVSRQGAVGTLDPRSGTVQASYLEGEEIQNTLASGPEGVFIVSDHALYCFIPGPEGQPSQAWREVYDRGTRIKPGSINQGSGTTPTLVGRDFVAITDNHEGQSRILFYWRSPRHQGPRLACMQPVFAPGGSNTENSLIALGNSVVVENNWFISDILPTLAQPKTVPGLARVDIEADGSACRVVWESAEMSPTVVPKLSAATGLVYCYTPGPARNPQDPQAPVPWYLTGLDFRTGRTVFKILTGIGTGYNNNWAPITLAPDGTAWVGTFNGLVSIRDGTAR